MQDNESSYYPVYSQFGGMSASQNDNTTEFGKGEIEVAEKELDSTELQILNAQLKNFQKEFGKTRMEICQIFTMVSGNISRIRAYLQGKPVVTWNPLEDMALTEPETSQEFQVLISEKGWHEIVARRTFLQCEPVHVKQIRREGDSGPRN